MTGVWFLKKSFGIVWKIVQLRIRRAPKAKYYEEYMFKDDDEENSQKILRMMRITPKNPFTI